MYCPVCGCEVQKGTTVCLACGASLEGRGVPGYSDPTYSTDGTGEKSEILTIVLSLLIPGFGYIYLERNRPGVVILVASVACVVLARLHPLFYVGGLLLWLVGAFGSYRAVREYNRRPLRRGGGRIGERHSARPSIVIDRLKNDHHRGVGQSGTPL